MFEKWTGPMRSTEASERLSRYCCELAFPLCGKYRCLIGNLLGGGKHKTKPIAMARAELILKLRRTVGMRNVEGKTYVQIFGETGMTPNLPAGWKPLSTPMIGALVGLDHSTVVLSLQKASRVASEARAAARVAVPPES